MSNAQFFQTGYDRFDRQASLPTGYNLRSSFVRPRPPSSPPRSLKGRKAGNKPASRNADRSHVDANFSPSERSTTTPAPTNPLDLLNVTKAKSFHPYSRGNGSSVLRSGLSVAMQDSLNKLAKLRDEEDDLRTEFQAAIMRAASSSGDITTVIEHNPLLTHMFERLTNTVADVKTAESACRVSTE